ncbi:MAG: hypothetical protein H0W62_01775 [Chitinophagales bacterium]|nr:hypothetical protein [Chitinophagales bacterium]
MEPADINLDNTNTLTGFYKVLEANAIVLDRNHDITELLLKYKNKTNSDDEKQKLQWEIEAFLYSFHGSSIFSFSASNGKEIGEVSEYPKLDTHQSNAFTYLKLRSELSTSPLLKARYNHLIWKSIVKKNATFAINASENYIKAIAQCCQLSTTTESEYEHLIGRLFENLVAVVDEAKVNIDETKQVAYQLLFKFPNLSFWLKHGIIDDMLKHPKIFKPVDFENVLSIFDTPLKIVNSKTDDFALVNYHLPTAVKVAQKTKSDVKKWYNEIGLAYLRLAETETDEKRNWIKLDEYRAAIDAFRQSGNQQKKEETEQLYFQLKPEVRLEEFRIDFDEETIKKLQKFQDELKEKALTLLKQPPDFIYSTIANGSFFPKYDDVLMASKQNKNNFLDFVTTIYFDNNKNITRKSAEKDETQEILNTYELRMKETLIPFLHYVIVLGIKSGHLTSRNFLSFLIRHSWIGKPHTKTDLSRNPEITNWINQIAPAIDEFFNQVLAWGESKYYAPNFILCIDSLTLKIEGLFRNFSERLNIPTSKGKKKGMQEALAHDIINNEIIKQYFDENDMLLFDYVFSNEGGLNILGTT